MRKIAIIIGAMVVVAIVAAGVFALTFDINRYRQTIQSQMQKRLGRPVTLGQMHLKLFPLRFSANDLAIADDPNFSPDPPFLKTRKSTRLNSSQLGTSYAVLC